MKTTEGHWCVCERGGREKEEEDMSEETAC